MKITYSIIIYNGASLLPQLLESIYPSAHAICIAEGPVQYFVEKGFITSDDGTNEILHSFPDPDNKIRIVHGQWAEKDDMCRAWFKLVPDDTDFIWCNDCDELMTDKNRKKVIDFLEYNQPTRLGFKSDTFIGGEFNRIIGGMERNHSFQRILKYKPGCHFIRHRQPTLAVDGIEITQHDISGNQLYDETGVTMWHGSYVFADDVKRKIEYYRDRIIAEGKCIPSFFEEVWLPWVLEPDKREYIEHLYAGVHEFTPDARGECYTAPFTGEHPYVIQRDMDILKQKFNEQLAKYAGTNVK